MEKKIYKANLINQFLSIIIKTILIVSKIGKIIIVSITASYV